MANKYNTNGENSITVRLDKEVKQRLLKAAEKENRTMSNYVKNLIMVDLEKKGL